MKPDDKPRIEIHRGDSEEWPAEVTERFVYLTEYARRRDFGLICAVGLHYERKRLSAFFSPHSSSNPHMAEMCDDIAEMFHLMARRLRQ